MSKKTIPFQILKSADQASTPAPETISALEETSVDQWVHQQETPTEITTGSAERAELQEDIASSVTVTIPAAPNLFEAVKIGFFLPYLTVWMWTLRAAQKLASPPSPPRTPSRS